MICLVKTGCIAFRTVPKYVVLLVLGYWSVYVIAAPVTVWDSHTYNLARLLIAREGGLFGNDLWNSIRQIIFPWAFDAIHYPFLFIGWGYALPSFICFIGLLLIIHRLVGASVGKECGWWCCLSLLSLPPLVFQATSTKNDVAVLFGVACWFYAYFLWKERSGQRHLLLMAVALGFAVGAKTTGLIWLVVLGGFTSWRLRLDLKHLLIFLGFLVLSLTAVGSIETYINNFNMFGDLFGPQQFIEEHQNKEGYRGALANLIRYVFGNINLGIGFFWPDAQIASFLEKICRGFLGGSGLSDAGYGLYFSDSNIAFTKVGTEEGSDFGPLGTIAFFVSLGAAVFAYRRRLIHSMSLLGFLALGFICYSIGWMPWNNRFLILPWSLWTLALTLLIFAGSRFKPSLQVPYLFLCSCMALAIPFLSFNRSPHDLWLSILDRDQIIFRARPAMAEVVSDLRSRAPSGNKLVVYLKAGEDSWTLPLLQMKEIDLRLLPGRHAESEFLSYIVKEDNPVHILFLNTILPLEKFDPGKSGHLRNNQLIQDKNISEEALYVSILPATQNWGKARSQIDCDRIGSFYCAYIVDPDLMNRLHKVKEYSELYTQLFESQRDIF